MGRAEYVAVNVIMHNGVRAYNPGDDVDARVVDGPGAWVSHDDVQPSGVIPLPLPPRNASQAQWAAYAVGQGMDPGEAADASRSDLIEEYGGE